MRGFDEFIKIAKEKYDPEDYPYGYRKGRGYVVGNTLKGMGQAALIGGAIAPLAIPGFRTSMKATAIKSAIGAGALGGVAGKFFSKEFKDDRDVSWSSSATQKKLEDIQNKITAKSVEADDMIHPMYHAAFKKTPQAKAIVKEFKAKGLSDNDLENDRRFNDRYGSALIDFVNNSYDNQDELCKRVESVNNKMRDEDIRTQKAYDDARQNAVKEGRKNRLTYKMNKRFGFKKRAELDALYQEKIAADAPDVENEKDIIPKLTQEITYSPKEKTPPTPGGKVTPSKYVQRKNRERFQG